MVAISLTCSSLITRNQSIPSRHNNAARFDAANTNVGTLTPGSAVPNSGKHSSTPHSKISTINNQYNTPLRYLRASLRSSNHKPHPIPHQTQILPKLSKFSARPVLGRRPGAYSLLLGHYQIDVAMSTTNLFLPREWSERLDNLECTKLWYTLNLRNHTDRG